MNKPNSFQLRRLRLALSSRGEPISLANLFLSGWKFYLVLLTAYGGFAVWLWLENFHTVSMLFLGFIVGALWRDLIYARVYQRFKPISDFVTDWGKVKQVLDEHAEK